MLTTLGRSARDRTYVTVLIAALTFGVAGGAAAAPGGGKGGSKADKAPPSVTILAPGSGATVTGTAAVSGSAADNTGVANVAIAVDGGAYLPASGTTSWSCGLNTAGYANGTHTIAARATDAAGNSAVTTVSVSFSNGAAPAPPPSDTTPPTVAIASPAAGATVSGTASISGTASDNAALARVEISVDGGQYQLAQGTSNWSYALNSTSYSDGPHTVAARAVDTSDNAASTSESVIVQNSTSLPPGPKEQLVTPEGVTIQISSDVTNWTAQQIYDLLRPNALELARIGPMLTIKVQTQYPSSTQTSASEVGSVYSNFKATVYLQATSTAVFQQRPDAIVAHEYGHVWTLYHLYISHAADWSSYLNERGIATDPRLDSSFNWSRNEMIADDYRLLFGTSAAASEMDYVNPDVPDPRTVAGLKDWFTNVWAVP